jgi:hypothetical protein
MNPFHIPIDQISVRDCAARNTTHTTILEQLYSPIKMVYPGQPHFTDFKAPILKRPIDDPGRKLRVICVGAGISGVTTAIRFPQHLGKDIDLQIYEKNAGKHPQIYIPLSQSS